MNVSLYAESVIGERHFNEGSEKQDATGFLTADGLFGIAVADGLGSCKNSALGSEAIIEVLFQWISDELTKFEHIDGEIRYIIRNRLINRWRDQFKDEYKDYDTTLHFAIFYKTYLLAGGIGDGMILLKNGDVFRDLSDADQQFGNQTFSLGSDGAKDLFQVHIFDLKDADADVTVALATDGISDDIKPDGKEKFMNYVEKSIAETDISTLANVLSKWIVNWKTAGNQDDKSLAIMSIRG